MPQRELATCESARFYGRDAADPATVGQQVNDAELRPQIRAQARSAAEPLRSIPAGPPVSPPIAGADVALI
jgi:hypothetical protein